MEKRYIFLVRHGALNAREGKRFIGQIDLPMSQEGINQAKRLSQVLSCVPLSHIFCSDLQRARHTAEIIAEKHNILPTVCQELREIYLGEWEGKSFEEICRKFPGDFIQRGKDIANFCPPGGESFSQCSRRVLPKLDEIMQTTTGNILIAGHAGVNRLILCHILGIPLANLFRISQDYGCLNLISYRNEKYIVKVINKVYQIISA
ncbi:alpha-ribazole phosphatase [Desulforamulus hydrothermalis]|uniref:Alpha-ribazole phosphatase n=1 Tax=Desulforamulus hydrothermalis Lam5 = DSM 18033 TaxID=1121428 RepID=K8E0W2_9FIRM|nr:alpha-ribazole phosphatase [Desulforamulus hydrothermalis]CCO09210.1 Alpha-ribazole phosphatase [Desulforamulus hydrothermalis Lam5 = DSM 18033]SHH10601.1 probable phosphoglycerate mutase [Desulforamulus hydrothermalis Lam5 = DSM 18033]